jgi:hypothetical protein
MSFFRNACRPTKKRRTLNPQRFKYIFLITGIAVFIVIIFIVRQIVGLFSWHTVTMQIPDNSSQTAKVTEPPPQEHVILSRTVDSHGADISVGHIAPPLDGLVVHIPSGAMDQADRITLAYSMRSVPIVAGKGSGMVIALRADSVTQFHNPVRIELHYRELPLPSMAIPYNIDTQGRLQSLQLVKIYDKNSTIVFDTFQPVDFTWVYP